MTTLTSRYQLLENISVSNVTHRDPLVNQFYMKGWTDDLGTTETTVGVSEANGLENIVLPTADEALQISSPTVGDTSITVLVKGYNSVFEPIQDIVTTDGSSGRTGVSLSVSFFRITTMRITSSVANIGTLYLSKDGTSLSNGVPSAANYIYSMHHEKAVSSIANMCIPPQEAGYLAPTYVNFSMAHNDVSGGTVMFQLKYTDEALWKTEFQFFIDDESNSQFSWPLHGIPLIPNNVLSKGIDMRIQAVKGTGAGYFSIAAALATHMMIVDM